MVSWVLARNKKLVQTLFMNIVMFCFKIKGLLWYIKDFLLKEKSIYMVEYNKLISEFDFHFYSLLIHIILINIKPSQIQITQTSMHTSQCPPQSQNSIKLLQQIKNFLLTNLHTKISLHSQTHVPKYTKTSQLQKQNQILTYELKILLNLIQKLEINEDDQMYIRNKQDVHQAMKIIDENRILSGKLEKVQICCKGLREEKEEILGREEQLKKKVKILENKVMSFQKNGGTHKITQLKQNIKQLAQKYDALQKQHTKCKEHTRSLNQRCKILQTLNRETQQKLSQALVSTQLKLNISNKQNISSNQPQSTQKQSNLKIQLMASKQEIRNLKAKIAMLEKQKQNQKQRHKERQAIYEKMMMKKNKNII